MDNTLPRFQRTLTVVLGTAMWTMLWLPSPMHAQSTAAQGTAIQNTHGESTATQGTATQDRQGVQNDDVTRRDVAQFNQFLDSHHEVAEQLRRTPSLIDDPQFLRNHPELNTYLQDHASVKQEISARPEMFMRQEDLYARNSNTGDRDNGGPDRDVAYRRDSASFDRFLDQHREIAQLVRKNPSVCNDPTFVKNHPALQAYLQNDPGVRNQLRQDPNGFMQREDQNTRAHDAMNDRMSDFGGFLGNHPDIQRDLSKNPSAIKDHQYVQNHAELDAYLNAHPDVRDDLMANPQSFVHGAQGYKSGLGVSAGSGMSDHGTGTTGSSTATATNPTKPHEPKTPER